MPPTTALILISNGAEPPLAPLAGRDFSQLLMLSVLLDHSILDTNEPSLGTNQKV